MMREKLRELAAKWRRIAHELRYNPAAMPVSAQRMEDCADELDAILAEPVGEAVALKRGSRVTVVRGAHRGRSGVVHEIDGHAANVCLDRIYGPKRFAIVDLSWRAPPAPTPDKAGVEGACDPPHDSAQCKKCHPEAWPDDAADGAALTTGAPPTNSAETGSKVVDAPQAPAGGEWVLVPRDPTEAMTNAYLKAQKAAVLASDKAWGVSDPKANFAAGYTALTAAAPQQPPPVGVTDAMVDRYLRAIHWHLGGLTDEEVEAAKEANTYEADAVRAGLTGALSHQQPAPSVSDKPACEPTKVHVTWERLGNCLWHSNCPDRGMFRIDRQEADRSLLHCVACGVNAWAPHGIHDKQTVAVSAEPTPSAPSVEAAASRTGDSDDEG